MTELKVYQIGVGSFGRFGFEKMVELHNHFDEVDVRLEGVCDRDIRKLEAAKKFAEANGIEVETFQVPRKMYEHARKENGKILVYDAGPADTHSQHIYESLNSGFFHLTEKPPAMEREKHLRQKKLAEKTDVFYKVDFIERENPVVKKTIQILEDEQLDRIDVFRESSIGAQKTLQPVERVGVKGGDILDKMVHEIYTLDFIESTGTEPELELEESQARYLMPKKRGSEKLMSVEGGITRTIDQNTATGMTKARFRAGDIEINLNSSWLGISREAREAAEEIEERTGHQVIENKYSSTSSAVFENQETRFFMIKGTRNLVGDMLRKKLYDLDTGEELETPELIHDQLYRVVEKAVLKAAEEEADEVTQKELNTFIEAVFDARDEALENTESFMEELEKGRNRLKQMMVEEEDFEEVQV